MFLTRAQIRTLTGSNEPKAQYAWLTAQGIRCWVNLAGRVMVPTSAIDGSPQPEAQPWTPDFRNLTGA